MTGRARYQSNAPELADVERGQGGSPWVRGWATRRSWQGLAAASARRDDHRAASGSDLPTPGSRRRRENLVDRFVFDKLKILGLPPSPPCTDAEFARRSSLDLCGILPDPADVVALESDRDPARRVKWIDRLLDRPEYADRFAMTWTAILRNKRTLGKLSQPGTFALAAWGPAGVLAENSAV